MISHVVCQSPTQTSTETSKRNTFFSKGTTKQTASNKKKNTSPHPLLLQLLTPVDERLFLGIHTRRHEVLLFHAV